MGNANLSEVVQLYESGFEEEESVEQLRLTLSQMNTQLRYAENLENVTLNMLKLLLGYPTDKKLLLTDSIEDISLPKFIDTKLDGNSDLSNNIDIKIAENNVDSENLLYKLERSKSLPKLKTFISANYTGNSSTFTFFENKQKWFGSSVFGVGLEIPIFSSFARSAKSQKARIAVEQAKTSLEETKERIAIALQSSKNDYTLAVETYFTSIDNLSLAESIRKKTEKEKKKDK